MIIICKMNEKQPFPDQPHKTTADAGGKELRLDSRQLFAGGRELTICHDGQEYRLRITRQNRLILTK